VITIAHEIDKLQTKTIKSLIYCIMKDEENRKTEEANQCTISDDEIQTRETQK
jgi:hypothetical protein